MMSKRNACILGSGSYAPEQVLPNSYFNKLLGEDVDTWLRENLTIRQRHIAAPDQATSDLIVPAATRALEHAGLQPADIDLLIVATDTPDYISPSTASVVQHKLGLENAGTFDLNTACAGFVTALDTGSKFIQADLHYRHVLVVGAYAMSKFLDWQDKKTATLFADGAGAVVLGATEGRGGYLAGRLKTMGRYHHWMGIYGCGTFKPASPETFTNKDHLLKFVQKFPKELNPDIWTEMIGEVARQASLSVTDFDHFFLTQININSIFETMDRLGVPRQRAHTIMDRYAYTGSACIPMALDDAVRQNKIKPGDRLVFMGSGGGLAFACSAFQWIEI